MFNKYQLVSSKAEFTCTLDETVNQLIADFGGSGQQPQIGFVIASNKSVLVVVLVQFENDVRAVNGPKKDTFRLPTFSLPMK